MRNLWLVCPGESEDVAFVAVEDGNFHPFASLEEAQDTAKTMSAQRSVFILKVSPAAWYGGKVPHSASK